ncbi:hypothetical protein VKT23_008484 [Stygiomarasmius scandens]|uniref:F-box domain-containing protein n=1 Tax=Marasmiellus scandens TaxID=2682957 RepID=A0ABR1JL84_9AGAR
MAASIQLCARCNANIPTYETPSLLPTLHSFRSLHIPYIHETVEIQENVNLWQLRLSNYEKEIARMEINLDKMKEKRNEIQAYIYARKSLLSPVRKLPMEVLTQIFDFYCADAEYGLSVRSTTANRVIAPTLTLSHVCTFWRKVTRSQPSLWSSMSLDLRQCRFKQRRLRYLVKCYLRRSKGSFLRLRLVAFNPELNDHGQLMLCYAPRLTCEDLIFRSLLMTRSRWREVELDLHFSFYNVIIRDVAHTSPRYPALQTLKLSWPSSSAPFFSEPHGFLYSILKDSPNLRKIELPVLDLAESDLPFDSERITSVSLDSNNDTWQSMVDALGYFDHLEHLFVLVSVNDNPEEDDTLEPEAFNDELKTLSMTTESVNYLSNIFLGLQLPSLTTLDLSLVFCDADAEDSLLDSFKKMLDHSPKIMHFKFSTGDTLTTDQILEILSWMPSLTHLTLEMDLDCLTDDLFLSMTIPLEASLGISENVSKPPLLPFLTSFDLSFTELYSCKISSSLPDANTILSMILSRRQGPISYNISDDANVTVMSELGHFALSVPARLCSPSERAWAEWVRATFRESVKLHKQQLREGVPWSYTLDLGEL